MIQVELLWNEETIEHIWERHHLSIEEVDEAFRDPEALIHTGKHRRQVIYGKTIGGRYLTIIIQPMSRKEARLITARDMTDSERKRYKRRFK